MPKSGVLKLVEYHQQMVSLILTKRSTSEIMFLVISGGSLQIFEGQMSLSCISYPTLTFSVLLTGILSHIITHWLKKKKKEKGEKKTLTIVGKKAQHSNSTERGGRWGKLCQKLYQELLGGRIQCELVFWTDAAKEIFRTTVIALERVYKKYLNMCKLRVP